MSPPIGDVVAVHPDYTDFPPQILENVQGSILYGGKEGRPQIVFIPGGIEEIPDENLRRAIKMAGMSVEKSVPEPRQKFVYPGRAGTNYRLPIRYDGSPEDLRDLVGGGFVSPRLAAKAIRALQRNEPVPFYGGWTRVREVAYEEEAKYPEGFYEWFFISSKFADLRHQRGHAEEDDKLDDLTLESQLAAAERYLFHARVDADF